MILIPGHILMSSSLDEQFVAAGESSSFDLSELENLTKTLSKGRNASSCVRYPSVFLSRTRLYNLDVVNKTYR